MDQTNETPEDIQAIIWEALSQLTDEAGSPEGLVLRENTARADQPERFGRKEDYPVDSDAWIVSAGFAGYCHCGAKGIFSAYLPSAVLICVDMCRACYDNHINLRNQQAAEMSPHIKNRRMSKLSRLQPYRLHEANYVRSTDCAVCGQYGPRGASWGKYAKGQSAIHTCEDCTRAIITVRMTMLTFLTAEMVRAHGIPRDVANYIVAITWNVDCPVKALWLLGSQFGT